MRKNVLIINPFGIGDVLFSTPLVTVVKEQYPDSYIAYICNLKTEEILITNSAINEVFVFERDEYRNLWKQSKIAAIKKFLNFWGEIKKRKFDIVFDLSLGKEYAFLCWRAGIKDRRGFNYKGRGRFLNHKVEFDGFNNKPIAEYYLDLLGVAEQISAPTVLITTDEDKAYIDTFLTQSGVKNNDILVGIAPGGGTSFGQKNQGRRRWGVEKFAELADKINAKVILIWGPGEENLIKEITALMNRKPLIAPVTKIREMAELCGRCKLVICNEGGPLHVANSRGVKIISIFGPVDEKIYGPYPENDKNIIITSKAGCRPCYKKFKLPECEHQKCLEDISVNEVLGVAERSSAQKEKP
jgi:heptosyltransferase-2